MDFLNPFRPGAGHMPPYLAGRTHEQDRFRELLRQDGGILENLVLTGLRGVGKTVLMETLKPIARQSGWLWTGADMSESATVTEERLALRLITDISVITAPLLQQRLQRQGLGFGSTNDGENVPVGFYQLMTIYQETPGLIADKLREVLRFVWKSLEGHVRGIVFAYDEAQLLADHSRDREYPLSMLLEVFQSLQRQRMNFLLVLTGLPTLFPRLVESRTYSERMFHVMFLSQLSSEESRKAIIEPTKQPGCSFMFDDATVLTILKLSGGYPYFIQFICREIFDVGISKASSGEPLRIPEEAIVSKLDNDFFAARWERATDRERDLLVTIASLPTCDEEFSVQDIVSMAKTRLKRPFSPSHVNQMLARMSDKGLIYKNRHGRYSFAVPLLSRFIRRQIMKFGDLFATA